MVSLSRIYWAACAPRLQPNCLVDQIRADESGQVWYRLNEKYGSGDLFWGQAEAFRPLTADVISPINPDATEKRIVVKIWEQTLSCFEGKKLSGKGMSKTEVCFWYLVTIAGAHVEVFCASPKCQHGQGYTNRAYFSCLVGDRSVILKAFIHQALGCNLLPPILRH